MIIKCEKLYQELLGELDQCRSKNLSFLVETEYCFHIAEKYHGYIRQELISYNFPSKEEEVHFFKLIKPKFIAETEYASLLNFAGNFAPSDHFVSDLRQFWLRQMERSRKFKLKNPEFYSYHISGNTNLDTVYYTRHSPVEEAYAFDKTSSNYDILIGQLMARERYAIYAAEQLQQLQEINQSRLG